jgi:hypothetical protein
VTPVETSVTGAAELIDLVPPDAVAIVPAGWPTGPDTRLVSLAGDVRLPLLGLRVPGPPVARLLALLTS